MNDERSAKPFRLAAKDQRQSIRDLDNVKPSVKPPPSLWLDHPRLAPPGMAGIKPSPRIAAGPLPKLPKPQGERKAGDATKEFKALAQLRPNLEKSRDR